MLKTYLTKHLNLEEKGLNNMNVILCGASGRGKTRGVVIPNLLKSKSNLILSDPKGVLYETYKDELIKKGYIIKNLSFLNIMESNHYNPFVFLHGTQDIIRLSHIIVSSSYKTSLDPFWAHSAEILLSSLIGYVYEREGEDKNLIEVLKLIRLGNSSSKKLDEIFTYHKLDFPYSWAYSQYENVKVSSEKTWSCILVTLMTCFMGMDTTEMREILSFDDLELWRLTRDDEKMAIFVTVSDLDRSMDVFANMFFSQVLSEIMLLADTKTGKCFKTPVKFIIDDIGSSVYIENLPELLSTMRSRNMSAILSMQSITQLKNGYGDIYESLIANCEVKMFIGGGDVSTLEYFSKLFNLPVFKLFQIKPGNSYLSIKEKIYYDELCMV